MRSRSLMTRALLICALIITTLSITAMPNRPAYASCCSCVCDGCLPDQHNATRLQISIENLQHENWMVNTFWYGNILPAMMMMTNQLSSVAMQQVQIIGTFMDAQMQMETQQLLQRLQAEAHKDYQPSEGLCTIGTGVQNLAASERKGQLNNVVLAKRLLDRQLQNQNTVAATSEGDIQARLRQYAEVYCNPSDNNGQMDNICTGSASPEDYNADIDFTSTIDVPLTLQVDFADGIAPGATDADGDEIPASKDEDDVMAMSANLFANDLITDDFDLDLSDENDAPEERYMKYRSLLAQRSVAQNTFSTIVGMKSSGSGIDTNYLKAILQELGIPDTEATRMLGDNPSYYAQMQLLSKKIFQSPQFYINLYDKPANVARKGVALQAIELMLLNDTYNSGLRSEMLLALALELELEDKQEAIQGVEN